METLRSICWIYFIRLSLAATDKTSQLCNKEEWRCKNAEQKEDGNTINVSRRYYKLHDDMKPERSHRLLAWIDNTDAPTYVMPGFWED